jgi:hypothetical protein
MDLQGYSSTGVQRRLWLFFMSIENAPFIKGSVKEILNILQSSTDTRVTA